MNALGEQVRKLLVCLCAGANIVSLIFLWICCASTWILPSAHPHLAVLGLAFPIALVVNLMFIPLWLLFKGKYTAIPVLGLLVCSGFILDYFPMGKAQSVSEKDFKIVSWNVKGFEKLSDEDVDSVLAFFDRQEADVYCLQECYGGTFVGKLNALMSAKGYQCSADLGRTVYSRHPMYNDFELSCPTKNSNGMRHCTLLVDGDTVDVVDVHLECNSLNADEKTGTQEAIIEGQHALAKRKGKFLWDKLAQSVGVRGEQVDMLLDSLDVNSHRSLVVCGDFNDTPISYAYQRFARRYQSAYRQAGFGVGVTYTERSVPVRIDHLFHSEHWETRRAKVCTSIRTSDHFPLIVVLRKH